MTQKIILAAIGRLPQDIVVPRRATEVGAASGAELQVVHVLDRPEDAGKLADITTFLGQAAFAARARIELSLTEVDRNRFGPRKGRHKNRVGRARNSPDKHL